MNVFLTVFAAMSALILCLHIAVALGLIRNFLAERRLSAAGAASAPPLSRVRHAAEIIIAVRDEERMLPRLLRSLAAQSTPDCRFLFVDDRSSDATPRLLDEFCAAHAPRARVIHNRSEPVGLTGKQAALDLAFAAAEGEVLFFTDGDCALPPTWVEGMLAHFNEPRVGVVLGRIELEPGATFLGRFQAFEQPLINQYNFGSAGIGLPTGCFGNNMAIRAEAVREAGGFAALGYSVTEDAMLLDAVNRAGGWKVRVCTASGSAAVTLPKPSWREYINQHTRWNAGALYSPDLVTRSLYILVVLVYLVGSLLVLPLGFADWRVPVLSLNSFLSIGLLAAIGGFYPGRRKAAYFLRLLPYLFFFGFFYSAVTVRAFVKRPFEWKGSPLRP